MSPSLLIYITTYILIICTSALCCNISSILIYEFDEVSLQSFQMLISHCLVRESSTEKSEMPCLHIHMNIISNQILYNKYRNTQPLTV